MSGEMQIQYREDTLDGEKVYVAFVKEFPGITAYGRSPEESVKKVEKLAGSLRDSHPARGEEWGNVSEIDSADEIESGETLRISSSDWSQTFSSETESTQSSREGVWI